ncbi:MAG: hypothetical protein FWD70_03660, partial [Desulfuromonadales bacterium]|nr:hypothetical protein [Desulfuromonadales bacterium]
MKIKEYFTSTNTRSVKVRTNILWSMILKGISVGISFLLVPLTLHYLDTMQYGIWLTLSTILTWINLFDIGLSNGLRNKLAESLATGDREKARIYVSTTFAILTIIMGICFVLFLLVNNWLDWSRLLNAPSEMKNELGITAVIVICFFCLQFIFKFIGIILLADQRSALNDSLGVIAALFSYIIIWVMTRTVEPSLIKVAAAFSATPVIALVLAYPVVFKHYDYLKPKFSAVKFEYTGELLGLGVQFFLLQISSIIVFSTSNIIISHMFGPAEV